MVARNNFSHAVRSPILLTSLILSVTAVAVIGYRHVHRVPWLIEDLQRHKRSAGVDPVGEVAALELGKTHDSRSVGPLIEALKDSDPTVQASAATALGQLGDPTAVQPLIAALRDPHPQIRANAAWSLGKIKDLRAVQPLIDTLSDEQLMVITNVATALGEVGDSRSVPALIRLLKEEQQIPAVEDALARIGSPAVEPLQAIARSQGTRESCSAATVLGRMKDAKVLDPLIGDLGNADWNVRARAIAVLGCTGNSYVAQPLIAVSEAKDEATALRCAAIDSLGKISAGDAIQTLTVILKDKGSDPALRQSAVESLDRLSAPKSLVDAALNDPNVTVREEALFASLRYASTADDVLRGILRKKDTEVIAEIYQTFLQKAYPGSEPALIEALNGHGTLSMAEDFLNCGNSSLEIAAQEWANKNGYQVSSRQKMSHEGGAKWGGTH